MFVRYLHLKINSMDKCFNFKVFIYYIQHSSVKRMAKKNDRAAFNQFVTVIMDILNTSILLLDLGLPLKPK